MMARTATPLLLSVAFSLFAGAARAQQISITFDDLPSGTDVSLQYPQATFSSDAGYVNRTASDFDLGTSLPNYLCTAPLGGQLTCTNRTFVDFSSPVNNLRFYQAGDNAIGVVATVNVFQEGAFAGSVSVLGDGQLSVPYLVDLSSFANVSRIEIVNITDPGGLAWDDFTFDIDRRVVIPASGSESGGDRITVFGTSRNPAADTMIFFGASAASVIAIEPGRVAVRTPPGSGVADVRVASAAANFVIPRAFTYLDPALAARYGNVGVGAGDREIVLLLNASAGDPVTREVQVPLGRRLELVLLAPSSRATSRFAVYAWQHLPNGGTLTRLPRNLGWMVFPVPFAGGSPQPAAVWNNLGFRATLGAPTAASSPAPTRIFDIAQGIAHPARVALQGIIEDDASGIPERVSVTNAILLRIN